MKKLVKKQDESFSGPLLADIIQRDKDNQSRFPNAGAQNVGIGSTPLAPPDLYQDAGSGYNRDFTHPQE